MHRRQCLLCLQRMSVVSTACTAGCDVRQSSHQSPNTSHTVDNSFDSCGRYISSLSNNTVSTCQRHTQTNAPNNFSKIFQTSDFDLTDADLDFNPK